MHYDRWLEKPYQDMYSAWDRQEWVEENSTYETDCCGIEVPYADILFEHSTPSSMKCPSCGEVAGIEVTAPPEYDYINDEPYDEY